ncbi:MAG TPA: NYN domain-containing protein [Chloroflexi bacterium]|nr:MAG: hypothetical protein B6243_02520 [Anaerolineaceae bacterium 4572_5.2]HEY85965.1 NYN domain-containing protein [Chloroflexota bacterium]
MLVLVDGHNLIGKLPDISLDEADDEARLITKLRRYRARTGRNIIAFFDSGGSYKLSSKRTKGGISIHYAPHNKTADHLIISHLQRARHPRQILLVSSDRAIQQVARQVRAGIISSTDFAQELETRPASQDDEADVQLSKEEIEAWLSLFGASQ